MTSLNSLLSPTLPTARLTLHLLDSDEHLSALLRAINCATTKAATGGFTLANPAELVALNQSLRLIPTSFGREDTELSVDADVIYLLRAKDADAEGKGQFMGGVTLSQRSPRVPPDVGWVLHESFHGHGYAAEAARALLEHVQTLGVKRIMACTGRENVASCRTAERAGLELAGEVGTEGFGEGVVRVYMLPGTGFEAIRGEVSLLYHRTEGEVEDAQE